MVFLYWHHSDLSCQGATLWVTGGGAKTPLRAITLCRMGVLPNGALNMSESLHLTINYLLRDEQKDLEFKPHG